MIQLSGDVPQGPSLGRTHHSHVWPHQPFSKTTKNLKSCPSHKVRDNKTSVYQVSNVAPEAANHQQASVAPSMSKPGNKATATRKHAEGQRQFRRTVERPEGWETTGPKCQQRHSAILWRVGGTYGPIIMVQWYHLMHILPLSRLCGCLCWITSFRLKNVTAWNLFYNHFWVS